jgi:endoglucanase
MRLAKILISTGIFLALLGGTALAFSVYRNNPNNAGPLVFSDRTMLAGLWDSYKKEHWEASTGRTLDNEQDNLTTSEGQSYTMLRAVWQNDKPTFDKTWGWTQEQLQHKDSSLFSWKWGKKSDGSYGVLTAENGQNTASDADTDIALALLMAGNRWGQQSYIDSSKKIISDIWDEEVVIIKDKPYLAANNIEKNSQERIIVNPSYLAPYAYKLFAVADTTPDHNWRVLSDSSYTFLSQSIDAKLDKSRSAGLPPDWVMIMRKTGEMKPVTEAQLTTNYGFDALRVPWRIAMDYNWNKDVRANELLGKMSFLDKEWQNNSKIASVYQHDGSIQADDEVAAMYGGAMGYFTVRNPMQATELYQQKLKTLYDPNKQSWAAPMSYYSDNWAWFGMALYSDNLPNLTETRTK